MGCTWTFRGFLKKLKSLARMNTGLRPSERKLSSMKKLKRLTEILEEVGVAQLLMSR